METIHGWCQEWGLVYQYMFSASVRARSIAKLSLDVDSQQSPHISHERSFSTKRLLFTSTMEDRSIAYDRVYRLFCKPRVCSVSATSLVQHLLDMSLRWWLYRFCAEVNVSCCRQVFPMGASTDGTCGVYEHPAWKDCEALFHDIEVDVALRTALRSVLVEVEHSVTGRSSAVIHNTQKLDDCSGGSLSSVAVTIHAISTLSRHCLFLERVLFVQFLTLNRASEGIVAKIMRRAVRDLLERPFADDSENDILSKITLALITCAREAIAGTSTTAVSEHSYHLQQFIASGKVALIFMLVDASGLSVSLNDTCTAIEDICFNAGAAATKNSVRELVEANNSASREAVSGVSLLLATSIISSWMGRRDAVSRSLTRMLQTSATTIFTTKVVDLARERHHACLLSFDAGSTDGAFDHARELIDLIAPTAFEAFAEMASKHPPQKEPQWGHLWDHFAASEIASLVRTTPARYLFPSLVKFCESSDHLVEALCRVVSSATRSILERRALVARSGGKAQSAEDHLAQLRLDAVFLCNFLSSTRAAFIDLIPTCSLVIPQSVLNGVSEFLRAHESIAVVSLVNDLHHMISVEGVRDGSCPQDLLDALISVVSLLPAKDVFVARYGESIGSRLLALHASGTWAADCSGGELEMEVIHVLNGRIGAATCAPLTAIVRDFRSVGSFASSDGDSDRAAARVIELCMVRWKGHVMPELLRRTNVWGNDSSQGFLGLQLRSMCATYEASRRKPDQGLHGFIEDDHGGATPSRQLHWAMCSGSITLHCYFPLATSGFKEIVLQCPPYVALVLDAVEAALLLSPAHSNNGTSVRCDEVCALAGLSTSLVRSVVLCLAGVGILRRSADGLQCGFIVTSPAKHRRMKVNPAASMIQSGPYQQRASTASSISAADTALALERQRKAEACIVRIMKSARQLSHAALLTKCAQVLSPQFEVTTSMFKTCVAEMISREYLKRVELPATWVADDAEDHQPHQPGYEYVA
jgi:hypothetical protein